MSDVTLTEKTLDHGEIKERVFKGSLEQVVSAAAEFIKRDDIKPHSIRTNDLLSRGWSVSVFYKEV